MFVHGKILNKWSDDAELWFMIRIMPKMKGQMFSRSWATNSEISLAELSIFFKIKFIFRKNAE